MPIFPRPQSQDLSDRWSPAEIPTTTVSDAAIRPQGYVLHITEDKIELRHRDEPGLKYGLDSIAQLRDDQGRLRLGTVSDWPDIAVRGFMLDISRDRVPTRETLALLVERLSGFRFNHLQLYIEHTFAYTNHQTVWADASPITLDDMRWLDELCADFGIELGANQNTFGHMERWLKHAEYIRRAETPQGWVRNDGYELPAMSLAPTQQNADLALELVHELTDCITSKHINIGCDETWEIGQGASKAAVESRSAASVELEHISRIAEPLINEGRTVQIWSDVLDMDPNAAQHLAEAGAIATPWWYEAPDGSSGFSQRAEALADAGFRIWLASGTSGWNSFGGRYGNARRNIVDAVDSALAVGADGVLLTEWGDNGHQQPPFATLPLLAFGGGTAWCKSTNAELDDVALSAVVSKTLGDNSGELARSMLLTGSVCEIPELSVSNGTLAFDSWIRGLYERTEREVSAAGVAQAIETLDQSRRLAMQSQPTTVDGDLLRDEQVHVANLIAHGLNRSTGLGSQTDYKALKERQSDLWLRRSRPGGLKDALAKMSPPA